MSQGANVEDLDVFRFMKTSLIKFRQAAESALINADSQASRTLQWLESEQVTYWQSQIRKRQELVMRCREAVRAKKIFKDSTGKTPSAVQEEKHLGVALRALDEAEMKLAVTKRNIPMLQKELEVYRGGVQALGSVLVTELPKAIAMLERLSTTLQDYVDLASQAPTAAPGESSPSPAPAGNMNRGGESTDAPPPTPELPANGDDNVSR